MQQPQGARSTRRSAHRLLLPRSPLGPAREPGAGTEGRVEGLRDRGTKGWEKKMEGRRKTPPSDLPVRAETTQRENTECAGFPQCCIGRKPDAYVRIVN